MHTVSAWNRLWSGTGMCDYMHEKWLICSVVAGTGPGTTLWRFWAKKAPWLQKRSNKNSLQQHTWAGSLLLDFTGWNILYFQQQDLKWSDTPPYSTFMIYTYIFPNQWSASCFRFAGMQVPRSTISRYFNERLSSPSYLLPPPSCSAGEPFFFMTIPYCSHKQILV